MPTIVDARLSRILLTLGVLIGVIVYPLAIAELIREGGNATAPGWSAARQGDDVVVSRVDVGGPADGLLRVDDLVVGVNAFPPAGRGLGPVNLMDLRAGDRYPVSVIRGGQPIDVQLTMAGGQDASRLWFRQLPLLVLSIVFFLSGCVIGLLRPDDRLARLYMLMATLAAIALVPFGVFAGVFSRGTFRGVLMYSRIASPIMLAVAYQFFRRFPPGIPDGWWWRTVGVALTAWGAVLVAPALATAAALSRPAAEALPLLVASARWFGAYDTLSAVFILSAFIASAAAIVRNHWTASQPGQRRKLWWLMCGLLAGTLPMLAASLWSVATELSTGESVDFDRWVRVQGVALLFLIFLPATFAYAVVRHRVIGVDIVIRKSLQYLLARHVLRAATAIPVVIVAARVLINPDRTVSELVLERPVFVALAIAGAALSWSRAGLIRWLDRRFFRDRSNREQILLDAIGRVSDPALTLEDTVVPLRDAIDRAFQPRSLEVHMTLDSGSRMLVPREPGATWMPIDDVTTAGQAALVVPIGGDEPPIGVVVMGEKKSEEPYTGDERRLLKLVAAQIAAAADRARLRGQVAVSERERLDVLARIDTTVNLVRECPRCGRCYDREREVCDEDHAPLMHPLAVERTIGGRYHLERRLGQGGMGVVYSATDRQLKRTVAIKLLTSVSDAGRHRFQREAQAMARLDHPHIVTVHDYGRVGGDLAFLVMEQLRGATLRDTMRRTGPMTPAAVAAWFDPVADAVAYAHGAGVTHRDLKPENIYLVDADGQLLPKLLDFGLAKLSSADQSTSLALTEPGRVMGTLAYMSPEQLESRSIDGRTDIFALGAILVEALTGISPFRRSETLATMSAVLRESVRLTGDAPGVGPLNEVVQKCLAKRASDRYRDVPTMRADVIDALRACPPQTICALRP